MHWKLNKLFMRDFFLPLGETAAEEFVKRFEGKRGKEKAVLQLPVSGKTGQLSLIVYTIR